MSTRNEDNMAKFTQEDVQRVQSTISQFWFHTLSYVDTHASFHGLPKLTDTCGIALVVSVMSEATLTNELDRVYHMLEEIGVSLEDVQDIFVYIADHIRDDHSECSEFKADANSCAFVVVINEQVHTTLKHFESELLTVFDGLLDGPSNSYRRL